MWVEMVLLFSAVAFLVVMGVLHQGFGQQPRVALARTPDRFAAAVTRAGGPSSVRSGLWLDGIFIVAFGLSATLLLRDAAGRWGLPLGAAAMDLLENLLIALLIRRAAAPGTRILFVVAVLKFTLYALTSAALLWRVTGDGVELADWSYEPSGCSRVAPGCEYTT